MEKPKLLATTMWICQTPSGGIPALVGLDPGNADCDVLAINTETGLLEPLLSHSGDGLALILTVFNTQTEAIEANKVVLVNQVGGSPVVTGPLPGFQDICCNCDTFSKSRTDCTKACFDCELESDAIGLLPLALGSLSVQTGGPGFTTFEQNGPSSWCFEAPDNCEGGDPDGCVWSMPVTTDSVDLGDIAIITLAKDGPGGTPWNLGISVSGFTWSGFNANCNAFFSVTGSGGSGGTLVSGLEAATMSAFLLAANPEWRQGGCCAAADLEALMIRFDIRREDTQLVSIRHRIEQPEVELSELRTLVITAIDAFNALTP